MHRGASVLLAEFCQCVLSFLPGNSFTSLFHVPLFAAYFPIAFHPDKCVLMLPPSQASCGMSGVHCLQLPAVWPSIMLLQPLIACWDLQSAAAVATCPDTSVGKQGHTFVAQQKSQGLPGPTWQGFRHTGTSACQCYNVKLLKAMPCCWLW